MIAVPKKVDVLKTSLFALEASLLRQIFDLRTSNFPVATISHYVLDRNTLIVEIIFVSKTKCFKLGSNSKIPQLLQSPNEIVFPFFFIYV